MTAGDALTTFAAQERLDRVHEELAISIDYADEQAATVQALSGDGVALSERDVRVTTTRDALSNCALRAGVCFSGI